MSKYHLSHPTQKAFVEGLNIYIYVLRTPLLRAGLVPKPRVLLGGMTGGLRAIDRVISFATPNPCGAARYA